MTRLKQLGRELRSSARRIVLQTVTPLLLVVSICSVGKTADYNATWTAPADFREIGGPAFTVSGYEFRVCYTDTSNFNWDNPDVIVPFIGAPQAPGSTEHFLIGDLPFETPITIALISYDARNNRSIPSNKLYLYFEDNIPPDQITDLR